MASVLSSSTSNILGNPGIKIDPSFKLVGVDVTKVTDGYRKGVYKSIMVPNIPIKGGINEHIPILAPAYGSTQADPIYTFQDKNNTTIVVATTNHKAYMMQSSGDIKSPPGSTCFWCLRKITTSNMSIPIKLEKYRDMKDSKESKDLKGLNPDSLEYLIFYGINVVCGYRCALSYIRLHNRFDSKFANSEHYLNMLFNIKHPGEILLPADKPELLICNGGSLTDEEYDNPKYTYEETCNVILLPAKIAFFRSTNVTNVTTRAS